VPGPSALLLLLLCCLHHHHHHWHRCQPLPLPLEQLSRLPLLAPPPLP
jgi:hypothetical protein